MEIEDLLSSGKPVPEVISREEIYNIWLMFSNPGDRTLFALLYITGCRITEALNIRPEDLEFIDLDYGRILKVKLITLKNRRNKFREIPVPLESNIEREMVDFIFKFIDDFKIYDNQTILRGLSRTNAWNRLSNVNIRTRASFNKEILENFQFKLRPHYLRHCRLTHLVQYFNFDETRLTRFAGWTNSAPAQIYVRLNWMDLAKSMFIKNGNIV